MKTILAIALFAAATVPAAAQGPRSGSWQIGNDSFHIYYEDLDKTSVAGRAQLLQRVRKAVARLCVDDMDPQGCAATTMARITNPDIRQALADSAAVRLAGR